MKYMSVAETAKKWGLTPRSVQLHCEKGNVPGATLLGKSWQIPAKAEHPLRRQRAGQDVFLLGLRKFAYAKLAEKTAVAQET